MRRESSEWKPRPWSVATGSLGRRPSSDIPAPWSCSLSSTNDTLVLIRNERFAVGETLWELPAGTREPGEDDLVGARRELEEETGYRAGSLTRLIEFYATPGICDEKMIAFVARDLEPGPQRLEATERIEAVPTSMTAFRDMLRDGRIRDGKTIAIGLHWLTFGGRPWMQPRAAFALSRAHRPARTGVAVTLISALLASAASLISCGDAAPPDITPPADRIPLPLCEEAPSEHAPLATRCQQFVDEEGRVVVLRGINARVEGLFDVHVRRRSRRARGHPSVHLRRRVADALDGLQPAAASGELERDRTRGYLPPLLLHDVSRPAPGGRRTLPRRRALRHRRLSPRRV